MDSEKRVLEISSRLKFENIASASRFVPLDLQLDDLIATQLNKNINNIKVVYLQLRPLFTKEGISQEFRKTRETLVAKQKKLKKLTKETRRKQPVL